MIFEKTLGRALNTCFHYLYNFCLKHFSFYEEFSEILSYMRLQVKYPLLLVGF